MALLDLALLNYYFQRVKNVFEQDLSKQLFDELWDKSNKKD